jgi:hypothetical protein
MQHLDEGTIHAWLDGALPPDEAAAVQAHTTECADCAATVAEARGFIAGASRILTALDDVPGGVVPGRVASGAAVPPTRAAVPPRRRSWLTSGAMRAAAVIAFLAAGGVAVSRVALDRGETSASLDVSTDSTLSSAGERREVAAADAPAAPTAAAPGGSAGAAATTGVAAQAARAPSPVPAPSIARPAEAGADRGLARKATSPRATLEGAEPESTAVAFGAPPANARPDPAGKVRADARQAAPAAPAADAGAVSGERARVALADTLSSRVAAEQFSAAAAPVDSAGPARVADQSTALAGRAPANAAAAGGERPDARGRIVGMVTDAATGGPLPAARVQLRDLPLEGVTDSAGRYVIRDVPPGVHTVSSRMIGFVATQRSVTVDADGSDEVNFAMRPSPASLSAVVVGGADAARGRPTNERAQSFRASGAPSANAAPAPPPAPGDAAARRLAGCYALSLSPWEPAVGAREDRGLSELPSRLVLDVSPAEGARNGGYRVLPAAASSESARQIGVWSPVSSGRAAPDSVELTWAAGEGGVEMHLGRVGDGLRGTATRPESSGRPTQRAIVRATRVDCQQ